LFIHLFLSLILHSGILLYISMYISITIALFNPVICLVFRT